MPATNKTAIVTGAASGIGRAMALGLLGAGIDVAAVDRTAPAWNRWPPPRRDKPGAVQTIHADLAAARRVRPHRRRRAGPARPDRRAGEQRRHRPGLDPAPTRAATPIRFWEATPEQWSRFLAVNATAPIMMARAVLPHMLAAKAGRVITVTTSLGTMVREGYLLYGASKAAAEAAMAGLSADLKGTGVTSQRAGARRRDQHAAGRRACRRPQPHAAARDHGAAPAVAGVRRRGGGERPALHRRRLGRGTAGRRRRRRRRARRSPGWASRACRSSRGSHAATRWASASRRSDLGRGVERVGPAGAGCAAIG